MSACFLRRPPRPAVADRQPRALFIVELEPRIQHAELGCYVLLYQLLPGRAGRLRERPRQQRDAQIRVHELRAGGALQSVGREEREHLRYRITIAAHRRLARQARRMCRQVDKRNLPTAETRHRDALRHIILQRCVELNHVALRVKR